MKTKNPFFENEKTNKNGRVAREIWKSIRKNLTESSYR